MDYIHVSPHLSRMVLYSVVIRRLQTVILAGKELRREKYLKQNKQF